MKNIRPPQFSFRSDGRVEAPVLNRIAFTALIHLRRELLGKRVASGESTSQNFNKTFIALAPFGLGAGCAVSGREACSSARR